ncbi:hypothetical protein OG905_08880 [Streptomyces sp. NBC_00322]|uniref:hypothetical protein n=1 Tax=Streptomyces sp. NBC_00322 TaxID=2975712 RepID=UPI002E2DFE8F|nr:hypothetical protein [Streptomyces sp. NBC_00322]
MLLQAADGAGWERALRCPCLGRVWISLPPLRITEPAAVARLPDRHPGRTTEAARRTTEVEHRR